MTSNINGLYNCYETLGVAPSADPAVIREVYSQRVLYFQAPEGNVSPEALATFDKVWYGLLWQCRTFTNLMIFDS